MDNNANNQDNLNENNLNDQNIVNDPNKISNHSEEPTGELRMSPEAMDTNMNPQQSDMFPGMNPQQSGMFPGMNSQQNDMFPGMNSQQNDMFPGMNPQQNDMFSGMNQFSNDFTQGGKPPKVKKPMTKGKIAGIISGAVALIALIVCGVIFLPKIFKPAKDVVVDALENTFEADAASSSALVKELNDITDIFNEKGGQFDMKLGIENVKDAEALGGLSIVVDEDYDPANKLFNMTIQGNYKEASLMVLNMIGTETTTYIQLQDMIDGYLSTPNDLSKLYENELFSQNMGVSSVASGSMVIDYFPDGSSTGLYSGYVDAIENLWDSVAVEKTGKSKITVNGKDVTAKEYVITLAEEDIEASLSSMVDGYIQQMIANPEALAQSGFDEESIKTTMEQVKAFIPSIVSNDFVVKVYVKGKEVVKITSADNISLAGAQMSYNFELDIDDQAISSVVELDVMGEKVGVKFNVNDRTNMPSGNISIYTPETNIDITFNTTANDDKKKTVNAEAKYNGESVFTIDFNEDKKDDNTFAGILNINIPEAGTISASYEGGYDIKDKVSYREYYDSIKIALDGEDVLELSCEYGIDTSVVEAKNIDSSLHVYDLSTMSESDFENMLLDNQDNITKWAESIDTNAADLIDFFTSMEVGGDYNVDDDYDPDEYEDDEEQTETDTLVLYDTKVRILGCLDGYTKDYSCEYFIDYVNENGSYIEYMIDNKTYSENFVEDIYIPGEDTEVYTQAINQTVEIDGVIYVYSMVEYDLLGTKVTSYCVLRQIGDDLCLNVNAYFIDEAVTIEELVKALADDKYEIISE